MNQTTASLADVLADPRLRALWQAAHRRLEAAGAGDQLGGASLHLRDLTADERSAVDRLLGVRSRGATVRVPLDRLDRLLRERAGRPLAEVVTELAGPLRDRRGEQAALADQWDRLLAHPAVSRFPELETWLAGTRWRRSPEDAVAALDVLERLPQPVRVGRTRLAARILGDAHALDDGAPAGRLVLSALAHRAGLQVAHLRAAGRRSLWADQGVLSDETSSTVLTLALRPELAGPLTEATARWADSDIPLPIPLAAVQAEPWRVAAGTLVSVCENPSVLAAAAGSGATMVCLEGWPRLAATILLRALAGGGARLRYHGDFGAGGIAIANAVIGGLGAAPWRLATSDYRVAVARTSGLRPVRGPVPEACWDRELAPAVRSAGAEVEEELVLDVLLDDLEHG